MSIKMIAKCLYHANYKYLHDREGLIYNLFSLHVTNNDSYFRDASFVNFPPLIRASCKISQSVV